MKREVKLFLRSAVLTAVVLCCIAAVFLGICRSYSEMKRINGEGERSAVFICEEYIRILDFKILKNRNNSTD